MKWKISSVVLLVFLAVGGADNWGQPLAPSNLFLGSAQAQVLPQSTTPNLGMTLPQASAGTWAEQIRQNFSIIDQKFPGGVATQLGIQNNGSLLPYRPFLNMIGSGVTCADVPASNRTECDFTGGGGGVAVEADTLASVCGRGCDWFHATTPMRPGKDSSDHWRIGHDATDGLYMTGVCGGVINECNYPRPLAAGKLWGVQDSSKAWVWRVNESTGIPEFPLATKRPRKWVSIPAAALSRVDGAQCIQSEQQINSGPTVYVVRCADNAAGVFEFAVNFYGAKWDGSALKVRLFGTHGTTESVTWAADVKAMCRGLSDVVNNTWSATVNIDVPITTAFARIGSGEVDLTPNGTCAADDKVYFHGVIDATTMSANAATFNVEEIQIGYLVSGE